MTCETAQSKPQHAGDKRSLLWLGSTVVLLHVLGWGALLVFVLPQSSSGVNTSVVLGLAVSAYVLGIRHAFDADHIVAIDNATRRLISAGGRPLSVGFWFALGHSTVVMVAVVLLVFGLDAFAGHLFAEDSSVRQIADVWGATVSGLFLVLMGALNLSSINGLRKVRQGLRSGRSVEGELADQLDNRGVLNRLLRPLARLVDRPSKMYPIGVLFGLGLDTAASVGVFVIAGASVPGLSSYAVLVLPLLFMAGMALFDTADGVLMNGLYRWSSFDPHRLVSYNLIVTGISVLIAFLVGGTGLAAVIVHQWAPDGGLEAAVSAVDLPFLGVILVAGFALIWIVASPFSSRWARTTRKASQWT